MSFTLLHIIIFTILCTCFPANIIATEFSVDSIRNHVMVLGDDKMQGRATGTAGAAMAAEYIAGKLEQYGIAVPPKSNGYYQEIPMHGSKTLPTSVLIINKQDTTVHLHLGKDFLMFKTGAETFTPRSFPLVFVGYGIVAPEYDYNDYHTVDVEDKIVVFLDGEPHSDNEMYFEGARPTLHSSPDTKQRVAISRGARGSILIPSPDGVSWDNLVREFSFEDVRLAYTVSGHLSIVINPDLLYLFIDNPSDLFQMDEAGTMRSFNLAARMQFEGKFEERDFLGRNIIGFISGSDRIMKDTYLILSAHYDHLGIGPAVNGDSIYNGVSDNASGTAVLLEIARVFARLKNRPNRSLIFIFVTGEEKGLLGSTYYTDNPIVPLYKTIANINIDGAALFEEFKDIVAIGSEYSTLESDLKTVLSEINIGLSAIPEIFFNESESLVRSDQFAFAKAGIPSVLLIEGLHYLETGYKEGLKRMIDWNMKIYHSPFDDLNQPLNFRATRQYAEIVFKFALFLANNKSEPQWKDGIPFSTFRIRSMIEKK